jgi:hypothetical protein
MGARTHWTLFSAPSRKTRTHRKVPCVRASFTRKPPGRGAPATPKAGMFPNFGIQVEQKETKKKTFVAFVRFCNQLDFNVRAKTSGR